MFGVLKVLFYTFVAVVVGVFIGTVPIGGRTIADRIASAYEPASGPVLGAQKPARAPKAAKAPEKQASRARQSPSSGRAAAGAPTPAAKPITASAANTPELATPEQKAGLERLIASRGKR